MAMIKCPECGRDISDRAKVCLGCGITKEDIQEILAERTKQQENTLNSLSSSDICAPTKNQEKKIIESTPIIPSGEVHCAVCGTVLDSLTNYKCPTCEYPIYSLSNDNQKTNQTLEFYRQEKGLVSHGFFVGECYNMGHFQNEPIQWRILAVEEEKALLISEECILIKPYHDALANVTWETCNLRTWLNTDFFESSFSSEEKRKIIITNVVADTNPIYKNSNAGIDTRDKIFLLSINEVNKYFENASDRKAYPCKNINKEDFYHPYSQGDRDCCEWWLRTPGYNNTMAVSITDSGAFDHGCTYVHDVRCPKVAVRPAMWIKLNNDDYSTERKKRIISEQPNLPIKRSDLYVGKNIKLGTYKGIRINWRILDLEDEKALLISQRILDKKYFHEKLEEITWENSTLRKWLNKEFIDETFDKICRDRILDQVFLLNNKEVEIYFNSEESRKAILTDYAVDKAEGYYNCCSWWTRSTDNCDPTMFYIGAEGTIQKANNIIYEELGVRPAMWIKLDN